MSIQTSVFKSIRATEWRGRYARIPGDNTVFHLKSINGRMWPTILWSTVDGIGTCAACECGAAAELARAVEGAKRNLGGTGGGSFVINEFGQVLVPACDGTHRRLLAGELKGRLLFENPFDEDDPIDIGDSSYLHLGDPWRLPYVGSPFNLSQSSKIYFYHTDHEGGQSVYPPQQDRFLVQALRSLRRTGAVRFIVNPFGVVLTKCPVQNKRSPEDEWQPFYVGRINLNMWFKKESDHA